MNNTIQASTFEHLNPADSPTPGQGKPIRWVAIAIAALFIAIMTFLFTAKSLQINVEALSPADVELSGGLLIPFGERYLLRPGDYEVVVTAGGYHLLLSAILRVAHQLIIVPGSTHSNDLRILGRIRYRPCAIVS